ncbi:MAG: HDIG domain-containing metalloprotein [Candidatus Neomarinimicrobiota bacterium]|nr:HDIG domain-containing metalloprotein [Candidatus Neomarinimicrobiota bacterium]
MTLLNRKRRSKLSNEQKRIQINRWLILTGLVIAISFLFPGGKALEYNYELGEVTREEIVAEFNFPILKQDEQLKKDLGEAIRMEPYRFERRYDITEKQSTEIEQLVTAITDLSQAGATHQETLQLRWEKRYGEEEEKLKTRAVTDSAVLATLQEQFSERYPFDLNDPEWDQFIALDSKEGAKPNLDSLTLILQNISRNQWAVGILDIPRTEIKSDEITVASSDISEIMSKQDLLDLEEAWTEAKKEITEVYPNDELTRNVGYRVIVEFLKPNVIFDSELTERRQTTATSRVPRYQGIVMQNERIVDINTRITSETLLKLQSYQHAIEQQERTEQGLAIVLPWIGRFILVTAILSLFFVSMRTHRPELFNNNGILLLFSLLFFLIIGVSHLFVITFELSEYLIPFTVGAMVLTVLFDGRIAMSATITLVVLVAFIIGGKLDFAIIGLFTSLAAIYAVRQLRTRAQLFTAILFIVVSGAVVLIGIGIIKRFHWMDIGNDLLYMAISGVLSPFITYGISALFEVIFGVTSDLTLLELTDFNHPLLKKLSQEANGTFNHCVVVGNLAESCANAVGANPLLSRVGAYYHDIGKLTRPEYFVENQFGGENPHDSLTPSLSSKIIVGHVKDGIKLAKEYRLPPAVADFIPTHHGTSRIDYFYSKALDQKKNDEAGSIREDDFKYSGPKPKTKETGLLMICEAVEAAVRSLKDPTLTKIEGMADKIIEKRLKEGQLDDCPLTMADLTKMKGDVRGRHGMMPVFRGIYHLRIEYPDQAEKITVE